MRLRGYFVCILQIPMMQSAPKSHFLTDTDSVGQLASAHDEQTKAPLTALWTVSDADFFFWIWILRICILHCHYSQSG